MKDIYINFCGVLLALLIWEPCRVFAQNNNQNYVETQDYIQKKKSVQYFDGLGRPSMIAVKGVSTNGKGVYTMTEYDQMGREHRKWLPAAGDEYLSDYTTSKMEQYSNENYQDEYGYSDTEYDELGRPISISTPGEAWNKNEKVAKTIEYITNAANSVKKYGKNISSLNIIEDGYYPASALTGTRTTDEDGHTLETYKDFLGNVVLERRDGDKDTYFVYDKNLLVMVMPPLSQRYTRNYTMVYKYKYDVKGRCVQKTLPGDVKIGYWYDRYGRVSFMQDGRLRVANKFRFYLYDGLNRLVVQGMTGDTIKKSNSNYIAKVIYGSEKTSVGNTGYYMATSSDISYPTIEIVNYYDGYDCLSMDAFVNAKSRVGVIPSECTTSLLTAQMVSTSDNKQLCRVMFYDKKANITAVQEFHADGTQIKTERDYSFTKKPTNSEITLIKNGKTVVVQDSIQYSPVSDNVLARLHKIGSRGLTKIEEYQYDDLGKVKNLDYYDNKLSTAYTYDIHGLTKSINSINRLTSFNYKTGETLIFGENLYYADTDGQKCYNGNISEVRWISGDYPMGEKIFTGYKYLYDGMDRLVSAKSTYGHMDESQNALDLGNNDVDITYNYDGSITSLKRTGKLNTSGSFGLIDDLSYSYSFGRLMSVSDNAAKTLYEGAFNFVDNTINTDGQSDYTYDACGALTKDNNKGITSITYDKLGNPLKVYFYNNNQIEYVYTADGIRLKTRYITAVPQDGASSSETLSSYKILSRDSTEYIGDFVYENGRLKQYNFGSGYIVPTDSTYSYNFYFKDHLGNIRVVTDYAGNIIQTTHYYPYGTTISNSTQQSTQKYKYNGKELDRMHGLDWYDYSARQYDAAIGRFTSMDPLCEKYYHISPYAYCAGNPIKYIDTDGKKTTLYARQLRYGISMSIAVHTFIAVETKDQTKYYAYGPKGDYSGPLTKCYYDDDKNIIAGKSELDYQAISILAPKGMSQDKFDENVINAANSFDENPDVSYNILSPQDIETSGNCNTSSSTLLYKAGVSKKSLKEIDNKIHGNAYGFGDIKPWTRAEKEKAVKERKDLIMKADQMNYGMQYMYRPY